MPLATVAVTPLSLASELLAMCEQALVACNREPITRSHVAAGLVAWDDCCGMLVAAPERVFRTASFPNEGQDDLGCFDGLIACDMVVLLLRCVPVLTDDGRPPPVTELEAAYGAILTDAAVIWDALSGMLPEGWSRANLNQTFVGAEGGCIGVETRVTVGVDQELWCPCL